MKTTRNRSGKGMEAVSISIGGSIFLPEDDNVSFLKKLAEILVSLSKNRKIGIVTGGGRTARYYIKIGRALGVNEAMLDMLGIDATRINARTMIAALGKHAYPKPALDYDEALKALNSHNIVVMGGTTPGHTTDAVTVILGERMNADEIIIATAVNGVYTKDPKKYKDAKKLDKIDAQKLINIVGGMESKAGSCGVVDPLGARMIARSGITTKVVYGRDLESLKNAIEGKKFDGTTIVGKK